jgi:hypothetical protein
MHKIGNKRVKGFVGKVIRMVRSRLNSYGSLYYRMTYNCEYANKYFGTLEDNTFMEQLVNYQLLMKD